MAEWKVELASGASILVPAGTPKDEIYDIVDRYNRLMDPDAPPVQRATAWTHNAQGALVPVPNQRSDAESGSENRIMVPAGPAFSFEFGEYRHDREDDPDELRARLIEDLKRRSGKPDPVHSVHTPPPASDPGRDNFLWLRPKR